MTELCRSDWRTALAGACLFIAAIAAVYWTGAPPAGAADPCPNAAVRIGPSANLPNCRAYEMVSQADKGGQDVVAEPLFGFDYVPIVADDGETASFESYGAFADPDSSGVISNYLARRGASGWSVEQISPRTDPNPFLNTTAALSFTRDLRWSAFLGPFFPQPTPDAEEGTANLFLRDSDTGAFDLVSVGAPPDAGLTEWQQVAISADGSHVVFATPSGMPFELTPDSSESEPPFLYDWDAATGTVVLVGRLPDNSVSPKVVKLAGQSGFGGTFNPARPVSEDGSRIFFETEGHGETNQVFVRINRATTQEVSASQREAPDTAQPSQLWLASADGSLAFFTSAEKLTDDATTGPANEGKDLYRYDVDSEELTDLTPNPAEEASGGARVQGVLGGAEDGSRVYFVAQGVLAPGATAGMNNLYSWAEGEGIEFIATGDNTVFPRNWSTGRASRVTPDGMHVAFSAGNSITGYPNEGKPEIYLYSAADGELVCASCNPSGEPATSGAEIDGQTEDVGVMSRNLSDDGRFVFFNTEEALVPRDVNGAVDAYQFDSETGEISLISTGLAPQGSKFSDATPTGSDALILTRERLVGVDNDENTDAYTARIEGGLAGQHPSPPPPPCSGTAACRDVAVPPLPSVTGSNTLRGRGNLRPGRNCGNLSRRARKMSRQARRLRRAGKRRQARRVSKRASTLRKRARRCKRADRRARR